jgi:hypothetical protein
MKTAMQEHIEWLKSTIDISKEHAPTLVNCLQLCLSDSESRLEIEKEQIIEAVNICCSSFQLSENNKSIEFLSGEQFYKAKYIEKVL